MCIAVLPAAAEPTFPFDIQNAHGAGLVFSATSAGAETKWERTLRIVTSGNGKQSTDGLILGPVNVETEGGDSTPLELSAPIAKQDLSPGEWVEVHLGGTFKASGVYRGDLVLVQKDQQRSIAIQVTIAPPPEPSALPIAEHGGSAVFLDEGITGKADDKFTIELGNTGKKKLDLAAQVVAVTGLDKADAPAVRRTVDAKAAPPTPASLEPGAVVPVSVKLDGVDGPGIYEAETLVRDTNNAYAPKSIKTIVYRRATWVLALLFVLFGAALAWGARYYVDGGEARLKLRRRLALLAEQIRATRGEATADAQIAAARALELDVEDRQRWVRWGGKVEDIDAAAGRATLRLALLRDIIEASQQLVGLDPERQKTPQKTLEEALAVVRVDPCDEAKINEKRTAVASLALHATRREQLLADLTALDAQLAVRLPDADKTTEGKLRALASDVAAARAELDTGALDDVQKKRDDIRLRFVGIAAAQLAARSAAPKPLGVADADWTTTTDAMKPELAIAQDATKGWPERRPAFEKAQALYIMAANGGLVAMAEKAAADPKVATRMTAIAAELKAITDPMTAAAVYEARRREITKATSGPIADGLVTSRASGFLPLAFGGAHATTVAKRASEVDTLDREVKSMTWLVNLALLVVAAASGVKALWLDNLSWGGWHDYVAAFLWGAGVQVTGNVFVGLVSLRSKLGGAPT
jgi:hypothetical protein